MIEKPTSIWKMGESERERERGGWREGEIDRHSETVISLHIKLHCCPTAYISKIIGLERESE